MTYGIRIVGLQEIQRKLAGVGVNIKPELQGAIKAIAAEIQGEIAPYPPATIANSPGNPTRHWYERGYGPRWKLVNGAIHGRATSQMMNRRWSIRPSGALGQIISNSATYSGFMHRADKQVRWAGQRGWQTDRNAINKIIVSGRAKQQIIGAVMRAMGRVA